MMKRASPAQSGRWMIVFSCVVFLAITGLAGSQETQGRHIRYELEEPGQVSGAVYDADGRLVRELMRGEEQEAGVHEITWDGLDRAGEPMPPGEYEWRVLRTPGFKAEYVTSLGINPGSAPWHQWVGNHGGAASVAVDDTGMYVGAASSETAPLLLKQSVDGKQRYWTATHGITRGSGVGQGALSLAGDGAGTLYMLQQNGFIQVIDGERGERRARWDVLPAEKQRASEGGPKNRIYAHGEKVADTDMDAHGETVVVSYRGRDEVWWIDAEDGSVETKVTVPAPRGVAVTPEGDVLVISEGRVLAVERDGTQDPVIEDDIAHAHRLTVDGATGHVLVAEEAPSHQVKRFTMEGKRLATYGREGGRRNGVYEPHDFLRMTDIAADGRGGFVVVEERVAPRRTAHFDADGKLVNEWYGGQRYYAWGEPDPRDPSKVWFNSGRGLVLAEVDYETGAWHVLESYELEHLADGLVTPLHGSTGRWRVLYHGEERYLVSERLPRVLRHRAGSLTPSSVIGRGKGRWARLERALEIAGADEDQREKATAFRWVDADGDGRPQAAEITFDDSRYGYRVPRSRWILDDLTLLSGGDARGQEEPTFGIQRFAPTWRAGVPVYPFGEELEGVPYVAQTSMPSWIGGIGRGVFRSDAGDYYAAYLSRPELHGTWPTKRGSVARLVRWDAGGDVQWKVARHAIHGGLGVRVPGATPPGQIHEPMGIIGQAHGNVILADRVETPAMAWTPDGLYAGSFFDRRADDGLPEIVYSWWRDSDGNEAITTSDNASGGRAFQTDDGTVLWFAQGRNSVPTYRIHGWDGWGRQNGTITLDDTPPHARADGEGLHAAYHKDDELTGEPDANRVDQQIWHGIPRGKEGYNGVLNGFYEGPAYDWSDGVEPLGVDSGFSVRWTGEIEAPLSEAFTFSVYTRGAVRLWIDGRQRIFAWNQMREQWEIEPITLRAGERYTVQLDYYTTHEHPLCSLMWDSFSIDRQRIPKRYLYPTETDVTDAPDVRPATGYIDAGTFDTQSGDITSRFATGRLTDRLWGLRHRGLARTGAYVGYRHMDFGDGVSELRARAGGISNGGFDITLEFRIDSPDGPAIATLTLNDERGSNWKEMPERIVSANDKTSGVHDLYIVNTTAEEENSHHLLMLHSFRFEQ